MLDMRSYRGPNAENMQEAYGPDAYFLGPQQVAWLKRGLLSSRATWKVIANDMPLALIRIYDPDRNWGYEAIGQGDNGAPRGRELELADILSFIKHGEIRNTVWLTADVHYTAAHYFDPNQAAFQRNIVMDGSPHLPSNIRQWFGDSRGHWEGNTLVIDATNFGPKTDFQGSRENLHLIERWTRTGPRSLEYAVTIEDPSVWTRPWTVKQEFTKQSDENRLYYEPRCVEGNYALPGWLQGHRLEERAFAEGRGPNPATKDDTAALVETEVIVDPLQ
jgi:hypothetical protein